MVKNCRNCGEDFTGPGRGVYCSPDCRRLGHNGEARRNRPYSRTPQILSLQPKKNLYGLTPTEFKALQLSQGDQCAICGDTPESSEVVRTSGPHRRTSPGRRLGIDHDHESGAIRGLLCSRCNWALGGFRDDPEILLRAIAYLAAPPAVRLQGAIKPLDGEGAV
jgi:Recombination endonuclease VII